MYFSLLSSHRLNKWESDDGSEEEDSEPPQAPATTSGRRFTTQDQRFLKALRIATDEEAK